MKVIHYHKDTCPSKGQKTAKNAAESMFDDDRPGRPGHSFGFLALWTVPSERWPSEP